MATTYVTVPGSSHVTVPPTSIVNPYNTTSNTALAQSLSTYLFAAQTAGTLYVSSTPSSSTPPTGDVGEIAVTTPGSASVIVTVPTGYSVTAIDQAVTGAVAIFGGGSLFAGNQTINYSGAASANPVTITAGDGNDYFTLPSGATYNVALGNGNDTVYLAGTGSLVGGTGNNIFSVTGGTDAISSYGANDTIDAAAGNVTVATFGANPDVSGGTGNLVYLGGAAGAPTITGATGSGMETLFGASGQDITYKDNPSGASVGSAILASGTGNETLNAGGSSTGVQLAAGSGSVDMVGSTGPDTFYGGSGFATMTGNGGTDLFVFGDTSGHTGGTDIVTDFNSNDTFLTAGYGSNAAATAFADATYSGGNSVVKLSDGTTITFDGINTTTGTWKTESF
jgi:Ca2+-binding RTX toxin-like protein